MSLRRLLRPGMRGYLVPLAAGVGLAASSFLPWVIVDETALAGFPDTAALWIAGLGATAAVLATLSLITRKNSRHPLLLVGLIALGILFLSWQIMPRTIGDRALTRSQAVAIVEHRPLGDTPHVDVGYGIYVGLIAALVIVAFGMTIVIRRVSTPYVVSNADDDVD
jgi:hypothetical protein